jgi:hypothetical protein
MARLREAHRVMRTFLDEGAIDFEGQRSQHTSHDCCDTRLEHDRRQ